MWANFFRDGGWGMYPTTVFGIISVASAFLYLFRPQERFLRVVSAAGILTFAAGLLGTSLGLVMTGRFLPSVALEERVSIAGIGLAESLNNLILGLILIIVTGVITFGGIVRTTLRPSAE